MTSTPSPLPNGSQTPKSLPNSRGQFFSTHQWASGQSTVRATAAATTSRSGTINVSRRNRTQVDRSRFTAKIPRGLLVIGPESLPLLPFPSLVIDALDFPRPPSLRVVRFHVGVAGPMDAANG